MSTKVEEDARIVHVGATVPQLALIFGMSQKTITSRVTGRVTPARPKGQTEKDPTRYHLRDVAPLLCDPQVDIEEILKSLTPSKIPPMLQDAFWKAQKSRLEVEEKLGNLWSTERVVKVLADAFKPCRMAILMFREQVEQEEELSANTRALLEKMSDDLLESMHEGLVKQFESYRPADDEHGTPIGHATTMALDPTPEGFYDDKAAGFDDGFGDD